jgi:hypothetical protein
MRSTHTRWAMFSPLLADQVIDISDMPQSTGSNKHIWRILRLIYPKSLLASCILLSDSWLKIYLIDISLSISLKMSSDKLYSDVVRSGSSDEDVASPVTSPIITGVSKLVFLQKSQTLQTLRLSAQGVLGLFSQSKALKRSYSSLFARLEFKV